MKANDTYGYEICCTLTFTCWATIDIETITNDFSSLNLPNFGSRLMMIFDIAILQVDSFYDTSMTLLNLYYCNW